MVRLDRVMPVVEGYPRGRVMVCLFVCDIDDEMVKLN
jgi:hypothetical protein